MFKDHRALAGKDEQAHFDFDGLYRQPFSMSVDGKRRRLSFILWAGPPFHTQIVPPLAAAHAATGADLLGV